MKNLLIVESPSKCNKIFGILKYNDTKNVWIVKPSIGHLVDLPKKKMGIDFDTFEPKLEVQNKRQMNILLKEIEECDTVYIGTDDDREGEAIGQNIRKVIQEKYPNKPTLRIRFNEITKNAILNAVKKPEEFNNNLYESQLTRRELDRIIGYSICPILWKNLKGGKLTAGRVQTCALMILAERELQRVEFVSTPFWYIQVEFEDGTIAISERVDTEDGVKLLFKELKKANLIYNESEDIIKKSPPPFNTSSLIQSASILFGLKSEKIMEIAQDLFTQGKITYHRTTNISLNPGFSRNTYDYLKNINPEFTREKPKIFREKGAHEGIRPTAIEKSPSTLSLSTDALNIYKMIWARTLSNQAKPAILREQKITLVYKDKIIASGTGKKVIFEGHYQVGLNLFRPKIHTIDKHKLNIIKREIIESKTEPLQRWTEANFIKYLEEVGIGRPSTYAPTIKTLAKNNYIRRMGRTIYANLKGIYLVKYIYDNIPDLTSINFTAHMEKELDNIETGKSARIDILNKYWIWLNPLLQKIKSNKLITEEKCDCKNVLRVVLNKDAPFLLCNKCEIYYSSSIDKNRNIVKFYPKKYYASCWKCHSDMILKSGKYGIYAQCESESCKNTLNVL